MGHSADINTPPANHHDAQIVKGMLLLAGITPNASDVAQGVIIPPFRSPNDHFETKGPGIIAALSFCIVIIIVVTLTRLYLRLFVRSLKFGVDDYLMIPALILAVAYPSLQIAMVTKGGAGKHMFDITYQEYANYKWMADTSQTFFYVGVGIIKLSISCFNIRLTSIGSSLWKHVNYTFLILCGLYTVAALFLNVFRCSPPGIGFNVIRAAEYGKPPECLSINTMNTILRLNLALDFSLLAIPIIVLWKVQMSWRKKARLFALLSIGAIACIASVMTLVSQYKLAHDPLWNYTVLLAWIMVELTISMIAACAPTLAFLFPKAMRSKHYPTAPSGPNTISNSRRAYGANSQIGKQQSTIRSHAPNEPEEEEEDERHIIVTEDIEMKWASASDSDRDRRSLASWADDSRSVAPSAPAPAFDGRAPGAGSRAYVVGGGNREIWGSRL